MHDLAPTPPMGWNTWNALRGDYTDATIREIAGALVSSGMAAAGYEYVCIDDCWSEMTRRDDGRLLPDPAKFPDGIAALADDLHGRGLKLGIYSSAGSVTCEGYPAALGHEAIDAQSWAEWGVDLLKYDNCGDHGDLTCQQRYEAMAAALIATGRPILFSLCDWGEGRDWEWNGEAQVGHMWRNTYDVRPDWAKVLELLDQQPAVADRIGPNNWADPDMLEVGNPGLTVRESRAQFALWCALNAPLIAGNDVRTMTDDIRDVLTNARAIAVNQDWAGRPATPLTTGTTTQVWVKPMSGGGAAAVLLNRADPSAVIEVTLDDLGLTGTEAATTDVWTGEVSPVIDGQIAVEVAGHDAAFITVR
ncbi:glycoside hydrolase family 27 protein [Luteipulveratus mongoliensis]|uniref:glycoside hydrolase family 27 protein n=1 Tax=Luteipulveratus mongoliensis TaxID=571913 RepID=UPI0012ECD834|nr:glycoside hydrolase family 27 protein [Luteipulveratus mongoliensis]